MWSSLQSTIHMEPRSMEYNGEEINPARPTKWLNIHCRRYFIWIKNVCLSPKFKRVSLNETPEFAFWDPNICVDFDLRYSKKIKIINKLKKKYFITKILIFTKLPNPIHKTRILKQVLITIPWLKFWALGLSTVANKHFIFYACTKWLPWIL